MFISAVRYFKLFVIFEMVSSKSKVFLTGKAQLFARMHEHNSLLAIYRGTLSNSWSLKIKGFFRDECDFAHYASFTHTTCLKFSRHVTWISFDMPVTLFFSFGIKLVQFASSNFYFFQNNIFSKLIESDLRNMELKTVLL